jgi:uncharacterized membrane protein
MARVFSFRSSFTLKQRERFGLRGWAGKPTHPPLADFPVSCYVLAAAFDVAGLGAATRAGGWAHDAAVAATWVQVAGLCASLLAAATGFLERPSAPPRTQVRRTVNAHAALMIGATVVAAADVLLRFAVAGAATALPVTALAVLAGALTVCGTWIGRDLVFEHGFRVEPFRDTPAWSPSEVDILPGGQVLYPDRWRWSLGPHRPASVGGGIHTRAVAVAKPAGQGPADDAFERLWQLDELRHEGVISQQDFERKKLELLSRI